MNTQREREKERAKERAKERERERVSFLTPTGNSVLYQETIVP